MAVLSVQHVCKEYSTHRRGTTLKETMRSLFRREKVIVQAVKDISFDIEAGEIVGILGKNGAGKSSLIKMLTGVLVPTSGNIRVLDYVPFAQRSRYVANIGAVFGQKSQLIWDIPPIDSFTLNKAIYAIPNDSYQEELQKLVDLFQVREIMTKPTRVLSLGERMKCEFIMAMLHRPRIVFLDEPTIGLDILAKETIRNFIREMNGKGVTFILTTHDIGDIEQLAHRVLVMNDGAMVFQDSLAMLKKHLGNQKRVRITMKNPLPATFAKGVDVILRHNTYDAELLVDQDVISMGAFIAYCNELGEVLDISIMEMSMEEILKAIYDA